MNRIESVAASVQKFDGGGSVTRLVERRCREPMCQENPYDFNRNQDGNHQHDITATQYASPDTKQWSRAMRTHFEER